MHTDEIFGSFKINIILNIKTKIIRKKENRFGIQTRQWFDCWLDKTANANEAKLKFLSDDGGAVASYFDADSIWIQFMLILMQIYVFINYFLIIKKD